MRRRLIACAMVGLVTLGACSGSTGDPSEPSTTVTTIETTPSADATTDAPTSEPTNEPTAVADRPDALKTSDLTVTEADGVINLDSDDVHFQVPAGFVDETEPGDGTIFNYVNSATGQSIVLMPVGVASAVTSGSQYMDDLNASGNLGAGEAQYLTDQTFGETSVRHFEIVGGSPAAIYAFDFGSIAYELTINAPESYLLEELRAYSLASTVAAAPTDTSTDGTTQDGPADPQPTDTTGQGNG